MITLIQIHGRYRFNITTNSQLLSLFFPFLSPVHILPVQKIHVVAIWHWDSNRRCSVMNAVPTCTGFNSTVRSILALANDLGPLCVTCQFSKAHKKHTNATVDPQENLRRNPVMTKALMAWMVWHQDRLRPWEVFQVMSNINTAHSGWIITPSCFVTMHESNWAEEIIKKNWRQ